MPIGIIGDLHFRETMAYGDIIADRRESEKAKVLDTIVQEFSDCPAVALLGDGLNLRNNPSEVIREFVSFLERFSGKDVYVIAGNHEKRGDGRSAIDFLAEIQGKHWKIFTKPEKVIVLGREIVFLPYMTKHELGVEDIKDGAKKLLADLPSGDVLFHHHAVSNTLSNGTMTDVFNEVVLPKEEIEKRFKRIVGGHIHTPGEYGKTIVTGSVFCTDMGEREKFVWKLDEKTLAMTKIILPGRGIIKLVNPSLSDISRELKHNIVKVLLTDRSISLPSLLPELEKFDAHVVVEQYPNEREKVHFEDGGIDLRVEHLLDIYAEAKKIDKDLLHQGLSLISK